MVSYVRGFLLDVGLTIGLFLHWLLVGLIVDATGASLDSRKGASLWLSLSSLLINGYALYRSFRLLGTPGEASKAPETVLGIFAELVSMSETWGVCFLAARTWSLPEDDPFHDNTFLTNAADSVFEMGLVQAGVGWAAAAPITFSERAVAWFATYVGGVLVMNLYFLTIIAAQRGVWANREQAPALGSTGAWKFSSIARESVHVR
jgi:hypothetical protein